MQNKIKILTEKIRDVYGKEPWYGDSMKSILSNIGPEIVFKKVNANSHSIAELLAHIVGWREFVLSRIILDNNFDVEQKESFNWRRIDSDEASAWKSLLNALEKNQNEIVKILDASDDNVLDLPVAGREYKTDYLIEGMIQHDIYHVGQISLLKKVLV